MHFEKRYSTGIETTEGNRLTGYAIVFNSPSEILHERGRRFREIISPEAVAEALAPGADIRALVNHDEDRVLGRTKPGTLRYSIDSHGVKVEIFPPSSAADVVESVARGDLDGMSFRFAVPDDGSGERWERQQGQLPVRYITRMVAIPEFSVVTFPAYASSSISLRHLEGLESETIQLAKMRLRLSDAA